MPEILSSLCTDADACDSLGLCGEPRQNSAVTPGPHLESAQHKLSHLEFEMVMVPSLPASDGQKDTHRSKKLCRLLQVAAAFSETGRIAGAELSLCSLQMHTQHPCWVQLGSRSICWHKVKPTRYSLMENRGGTPCYHSAGMGIPCLDRCLKVCRGQQEQLFAPHGQVCVSINKGRIRHLCGNEREKRLWQGGEAGAALQAAAGRSPTGTLGTTSWTTLDL